MSQEQQYDTVWFRERAINSLKRLDEHTWDYSDSLLMYTPRGQVAYTDAQVDASPYFDIVTKPEHEHLRLVADQVAPLLPTEIEFVDLGHGTENKEACFFEAFKKHGTQFVYEPVDVSEHFLNHAIEYARQHNVPIAPIHSSFEELAVRIETPRHPRLVSLLGLTFGNYTPSDILILLKSIAHTGGFIFFDIQLADKVDTKRLQEIYDADVSPACDEKMRLLDLDPQTDITNKVTDEQVAMYCTLVKPTPTLATKGLRAGDTIKVFQSLRHTRESVERSLAGMDYQLFDTGDSFLSVLIKT